MLLDVIIPVKDRSTVLRCVTYLREQIAIAQGITLGRILVCDGGSKETSCQQQLANITQWAEVEVLGCAHTGFNKGWLINQGLMAASAPWVLISDVDILWPSATLEELATAARPEYIHYVQDVRESQPGNTAIKRSRYSYRLNSSEREPSVEIFADFSESDFRPGCGLVFGAIALFRKIGGYRHCFRGWGWEDQDLLIRAQLLGYCVDQVGTVTHLSHGDSDRNSFHEDCLPQMSRDRNIEICLEEISKGRLIGDLQE